MTPYRLLARSALLAAVGWTLPAWADEPAADPAAVFKKLDRNGDGVLSAEEFASQNEEAVTTQETWKPANEKPAKESKEGERGHRFADLDKNNDGRVTADEVPEEHRERITRLMKRLDVESLMKADFERLGRRPGDGPGGPRPPFGPPAGFRPDPEHLFDRLDRNDDGKVAADEFPEPLARLKKAVYEKAGKEESASLSKEEFVKNFPSREGRPEGDGPRGEGRREEGRREGDREERGERRPPRDGDKPKEDGPHGKSRHHDGDRRDGDRHHEHARHEGDHPHGHTRDGDRPGEHARHGGPARQHEDAHHDGRHESTRRPDGQARRGHRDGHGRSMAGRRGGLTFVPAFVRVLDANHDGRLTLEEAERTSLLFRALDRNRDGQLGIGELLGFGTHSAARHGGPGHTRHEGDGPSGHHGFGPRGDGRGDREHGDREHGEHGRDGRRPGDHDGDKRDDDHRRPHHDGPRDKDHGDTDHGDKGPRDHDGDRGHGPREHGRPGHDPERDKRPAADKAALEQAPADALSALGAAADQGSAA